MQEVTDYRQHKFTSRISTTTSPTWADLRVGSMIQYLDMTLCVASLPTHCSRDADGPCDDYTLDVVEIATGQASSAAVPASAAFALITTL